MVPTEFLKIPYIEGRILDHECSLYSVKVDDTYCLEFTCKVNEGGGITIIIYGLSR